MTRTALPALALAAGLALAPAARAHAKLVGATPPAGGAAKAPVAALELDFSEAVSPKLSGATVRVAGGVALAAKAGVGKGGKALSLAPAAPLKPGAYTVEWHAVASDDGHRTNGSYGFIVR